MTTDKGQKNGLTTPATKGYRPLPLKFRRNFRFKFARGMTRKRVDSRVRGNDKEEKTKNMGETPMLRKTTAGGGCATKKKKKNGFPRARE